MKQNEIINIIEQKKTFMVTSHIIPDGDCVGSVLALSMILKKKGKTVMPVLKDPVPQAYKFLPGTDEITAESPRVAPDVVFVLDCGELKRTGLNFTFANNASTKVVNIDHHEANEMFGDINWIDTSASSVGEMLYYMYNDATIIDKPVSELLYVSLMTDTGNFRYSNTTVRCFNAAAGLVEKGVKPDHIYRQVYEKRTPQSLNILAKALETLKISPDGSYAWMAVTRDLIKQAGAREEDLDGVVNYARELDGVEVALLFKETDAGKIRVSIRSNDYVDVSELARLFGGGGHKRAAGCTIETGLGEAVKMVIDKADSMIHSDYPG